MSPDVLRLLDVAHYALTGMDEDELAALDLTEDDRDRLLITAMEETRRAGA